MGITYFIRARHLFLLFSHSLFAVDDRFFLFTGIELSRCVPRPASLLVDKSHSDRLVSIVQLRQAATFIPYVGYVSGGS